MFDHRVIFLASKEEKTLEHGDRGRTGRKLPFQVRRAVLNYVVDVSILATGLTTALTGLIKWPGLVYSAGLSYSSLPMGALTTLHDWAGISTCVLGLVHVVLHLKWMIAMTKKLLLRR